MERIIMKIRLEQKIFYLLSDTVISTGLEAYVVGGYVRDTLLGKPSDDIDVVVVGSGIKFAKEFAKRVESHVDVYENFGTAKVNYNGLEVEFVGARKESYSRGSRKPIVENGTLYDDQLRRDFTLNSLAASLIPSTYGEIVDPFGGLDDLSIGLLKTPTDPNITFSDDPLRMLRCVRFACRFGFKIDDTTYQALCNNHERLKIISSERITTELEKILMSQDPVRGIQLLHSTGLLGMFLPEVDCLDYLPTEGHHKNIYLHSLKVFSNVIEKTRNGECSNPVYLRFAALLHDIGKPKTARLDESGDWTFHDHERVGEMMVEIIFRRLKMSLLNMEYVKELVRLHMRPSMISTHEITDSGVRRLLSDAGDIFWDLMILSESDVTTKYEEKRKRLQIHYDRLKDMVRDLEARDYRRLFQPCINGNQLMEIFNLRPGKEVGELKEIMKNAILDGIVENTEEALIKFITDERTRIKTENRR